MARMWTSKELLRDCTRAQVRTRVDKRELFQLAWGIYSGTEPDSELRLKALATVRGLIYTGVTAMQIYESREVQWPVHARHRTGSRRTAESIVIAGVPDLLRYRQELALVTPIQAAVDADVSTAELGEFGMYAGIGVGEELERDVAALNSGRERARELIAEDLRAVVLSRMSPQNVSVPGPQGKGIWTRHPAL